MAVGRPLVQVRNETNGEEEEEEYVLRRRPPQDWASRNFRACNYPRDRRPRLRGLKLVIQLWRLI